MSPRVIGRLLHYNPAAIYTVSYTGAGSDLHFTYSVSYMPCVVPEKSGDMQGVLQCKGELHVSLSHP